MFALNFFSITFFSQAQTFLFELSQALPDNHERVQLVLSCLELPAKLKQCEENFRLLTAALEAATEATSRLSQLLRLILAMGNYMNRGTTHGDAQGFSIVANLATLNFVKATDGRTTLMEVAVRQVRKLPRFRHLERVSEDVQPLQRAVQATQSQLLQQNISALNQEIQRMHTVLQKRNRKVEQLREAREKKQKEKKDNNADGDDDDDDASSLDTSTAALEAAVDGDDGLVQYVAGVYDRFKQPVAKLMLGQQTLNEEVSELFEFYGEESSSSSGGSGGGSAGGGGGGSASADDETVIFKALTTFARDFNIVRDNVVKKEKQKVQQRETKLRVKAKKRQMRLKQKQKKKDEAKKQKQKSIVSADASADADVATTDREAVAALQI